MKLDLTTLPSQKPRDSSLISCFVFLLFFVFICLFNGRKTDG